MVGIHLLSLVLVVYFETSCVVVLDRSRVVAYVNRLGIYSSFTLQYFADIMTFPQAHQTELVALADLAGITATPGVVRIAIELLALEISPEDIYVLLKQICPRTPSEDATTPNASSIQLPEDEKSEKS